MAAKNLVQKILLATPEFAREIEDFRFRGRFKSEADALRLLIRKGLDLEKSCDSDLRGRQDTSMAA